MLPDTLIGAQGILRAEENTPPDQASLGGGGCVPTVSSLTTMRSQRAASVIYRSLWSMRFSNITPILVVARFSRLTVEMVA